MMSRSISLESRWEGEEKKRRIIAVLLCWMLCGTTASGAVQEGEVTTTIRSGEVRIRMHRYGDEKKKRGGKIWNIFCRDRKLR